MINLFSVKEEAAAIKHNVLKKWETTLNQGSFVGRVEDFEKDLSKYYNDLYSATCASGTDAILLTLKALGVNKDTRVGVPVITFTATAEAVERAGGQVVFLDVFEDGLINHRRVEDLNLDIILPVHLWGKEVNVPRLKHELGNRLKVVEDASQAFGLEDLGKHSEAATFSFYPTKNLGGAGDGGAVISRNSWLVEQINCLRNHGRFLSNDCFVTTGYNSRLDSLQADFLSEKLSLINGWIETRQKIADLYRESLPEELCIVRKEDKCVYYVFPIKVNSKKRDSIIESLKTRGVHVGVHYSVPLHLQTAWRHLGRNVGDFPSAERLTKELISLPCHPFLVPDDVEYVCESLKEHL